MTSDRQWRANQANAKASRGPKTKAGKARAAQNALRHGLSIPVSKEPSLSIQAKEIALGLAGPDADETLLDRAQAVGEAQVNLNRVRSLRRDAIARMLSDPRGGSPLGTREVRLLGRFLDRVERDTIRPVDIETINQVLHPKPLEWDAKLAGILADWSGELARLDRYERRAISKRKSAIRAFDSASVSRSHPSHEI